MSALVPATLPIRVLCPIAVQPKLELRMPPTNFKSRSVTRWLTAFTAALVAGHTLAVFADGSVLRSVIAFAGTNQVRVRCELALAPNPGVVELTGEIRHAKTGARLWQGPLGQTGGSPGEIPVVTHTITGLQPELWSLVAPTLYQLKVTAHQAGQNRGEHTVRFGFRSFEIRDGQFHLNGHPIFLRGVAINPPGRGIPAEVGESRQFAEDYVRFLKAQNLNIFRLSTDGSPVWFDVCDELGMMLYAGRYGAPVASEKENEPEAKNELGEETGKRSPPRDFAKSIAGYKQLFSGYASHPSIVEYYLSNELPVSGARGAAFSDYLTRAIAELKLWDATRPYIGNAGYGEGREGDVCDVHRYWGWYYNSFLTYYNLRDKLFPQPLFGDPVKHQPLTFSECVGAFTGSSGEINVIRSKQLAPRLGWIGHTETPRADALEYQAFVTKQACETFRRMRPLNPRLAGLMPFTILFYNWSGISSFAEMKPKPVMDAMRVAYQPVLLSWELWTPQVYAGSEVRAIAHVVNDDDANRALTDATLVVAVRGADGREFCADRIPLPAIAHFGTWSQAIHLKLPATLPGGEYVVTGRVMCGAETRSTNGTPFFIAGRDWKESAPRIETTLHIYDPANRTAAALKQLGIRVEPLPNLASFPASVRTLVIGEGAWDQSLSAAKPALAQFVRSGGRILCLAQTGEAFDSSWLPQEVEFFTSSPNDPDYPPRSRPFREQMNVNPERPDHPVFKNLDRRRLRLWSDYTGWDQTKPGFPKVYPVGSGFKLVKPEALERTAILADYDRGLEGIALCEMFDGAGSVILSGFDLVNRAGLDPAADRLLANLVSYAAAHSGHEIHPLVEAPIRWGEFPSERGVVCGSLNGLLPNTEWMPAPDGPKSKPLAANTGAWNMLPGEQFVPRGRHPFGEYGYSTASSLKLGSTNLTTGGGFFWARLPAGKKAVVTTVRNPGKETATLTVTAGKAASSATVSIASGRTETVRAALPVGSTNVCVRFSGTRALVLETTAFE